MTLRHISVLISEAHQSLYPVFRVQRKRVWLCVLVCFGFAVLLTRPNLMEKQWLENWLRHRRLTSSVLHAIFCWRVCVTDFIMTWQNTIETQPPGGQRVTQWHLHLTLIVSSLRPTSKPQSVCASTRIVTREASQETNRQLEGLLNRALTEPS